MTDGPKSPDSEARRARRESYDNLVRHVQLVDVYLTATYAHLNLPPDGNLTGLALTIPKAQTNAWYDADDALLHCDVGFQLVQRVPDSLAAEVSDDDRLPEGETSSDDEGPRGPQDDDVVFIGGDYHLVYSVPADAAAMAEDGAALFCARNGVYNAWPFFRELAQSTSARMSIAPVILPLLRLPLARTKPNAVKIEESSRRR